MHLSVLPPLGRVRISAPIGTKDETIKQPFEDRLDQKQIQKFESQPRQSVRSMFPVKAIIFGA